MYTHRKHCVVAPLSLSLSFFSTLSLATESQPPGRTTELIDCALQIDFEQKVSALSLAGREPKREGVSDSVRDAEAASLKSSSTL